METSGFWLLFTRKKVKCKSTEHTISLSQAFELFLVNIYLLGEKKTEQNKNNVHSTATKCQALCWARPRWMRKTSYNIFSGDKHRVMGVGGSHKDDKRSRRATMGT